MLRRILGDKIFFAGIKSYYNQHKDSVASSEDLRIAMERASRRDLKSFFDRWIYKAGHPVYQLQSRNLDNGMVELILRQMQPDEAFLMPVTIEIRTKTGKRRVSIKPVGKETILKIRSSRPDVILIDPDEAILKEVVQ